MYNKLSQKIEIVNDKLLDLNEKMQDYNSVIRLSKYMLKFQICIIALALIYSFATGGLSDFHNFIINGIYNSIQALMGCFIPVSITTIFFSITKHQCKRKANKLEKEIKLTQTLKEQYEKELIEIKAEKSPAISNYNCAILPVAQTSIIEEVEKELSKTYEKMSNENNHRHVRKRTMNR